LGNVSQTLAPERRAGRRASTTRLDLVDLWALGQAIDRLVQDELRRRGRSGSLLAILAAAARRPMTTSELSEVLGQAFMTTSDQIDRLERTGEVRRAPNPADGRSRLVEVTAAGRRRLRATGPHIRALESAIAERLEGTVAGVSAAVADLRHAIDDTASDLEAAS
jgi:DNA-binding MarR family transcriptional regulator